MFVFVAPPTQCVFNFKDPQRPSDSLGTKPVPNNFDGTQLQAHLPGVHTVKYSVRILSILHFVTKQRYANATLKLDQHELNADC